MTPSSRRMLASMLLGNAQQPVQHPLQAISNLANTYFGYKALGDADKAEKADKSEKSMILNQAIRARRGWTNPDDSYIQLSQPIVKGVPIAQQPGAKIMPTPRNKLGQKIPQVPGSTQAMADVLLGAGAKYPDLMELGLKLDPTLNISGKGNQGTAINYYNFLTNLIKKFPPTQQADGSFVDSPEVARMKQAMKIDQPKVFNLNGALVRVPTAGGGPEVLREAELKPSDEPAYLKKRAKILERAKGATKRAELRLSEGKSAAKMLPVIRRSIELLEDIPTGGVDAFKSRVRQIFGIESADEGELAQNLGKAVLSQLRETFGAAFTEKEGDRLAAIEAGFSKSPEANLRVLKNLLALNEEYYRQGLFAAEDLEDESSLKSLRGLNKIRLGLDSDPDPNLDSKASQKIQKKTVSDNKTDNDAAREWLKNNPNDPDAPAIRKKLGL